MDSRFFYPTNTGSLGKVRRLARQGSAVARELKSEQSPAGLRRESGSHSQRTILIAEDNEDARYMLRILLELKGYRVLEASTGIEAIESAVRDRPDLLLLDWQLPSINGVNVTRYIRDQGSKQYLPIVMVSGHNPSTHGRAAQAAGCDGYLLKPIDPDELDRLLQSFVPLPDAGRSAAAS